MVCCFVGRAFVLKAEAPACGESAEIKALFDADRSDRNARPVVWSVVNPCDRERRMRVREILAAGRASCPADWYRAAWIFHHGQSTKDYLAAHILATAAAFEGHKPARKLSALALDRYLGRAGEQQVFGTQFHKRNGEDEFSLKPFDSDAVPGEIRRVFGFDGPADPQRLERLNGRHSQ